MRGLKAQILFI